MRKTFIGMISGLAATVVLMGGTAFAASIPAPAGILTAQPEGTLIITAVSSGPRSGQYQATWDWSSPAPGLEPNQEVMLVGDSGTSVSLSTTPETIKFGQASASGGTATLYFTSKATLKIPEAFEMFALFSSTPYGQLPEARYAVGLPLIAVALIGGFVLLRRIGRA